MEKKKLYLCAINFCLAAHLCAQTPHKEHVAAGNWSEIRKKERTRAKEDQAGLQSLQLNLRIKVMKLHGAEDLVHGHGQLIQTGCPTNTRRLVSKLVRNPKCSPQCVWIVNRLRSHLPWKSRFNSLQALMETSAESECLFIISTKFTWRPLDSSKERILPANKANVYRGNRQNSTVFIIYRDIYSTDTNEQM